MKKLFYKTFLLFVILDIIFGSFYFFVLKDRKIDVVASVGYNILDLHFLDVMQGDCELAVYDGKVILIDTGEDNQYDSVKTYLNSMDIKKIDYFIISHPHTDHMGGADNIIKDFEIGEIYMPYAWSESTEMSKMLQAIDEKDYLIKIPYCGQKIDLGGCVIEFIGPVKLYEDKNNMSLNVKIIHGDNTILYMGDTEKEAEMDLIASGCELDADLLKVGHHGSSTSSSEEFLNLVTPDYAVISCGTDNEYGHPHRETINNLRNMNTEIFRTDSMGTIVAVSDGTKISVTTEYPGLYPQNKIDFEDLEGKESHGISVFIPLKLYKYVH